MIAVLVHQALHVALKKAVALQALVEKGGIGGVALRQPRVDDLDGAAEFDAQRVCAVAHAVLAPDEQRRPETLPHEARGGADDLLLFALGENDALRPPAQPLVHALEDAGHRIAARAQLCPVGVHVDDGTPGDAAVHGGGRHRGRNGRDQPRIERHRDDVFGPVFRPDAIRGGDLIGNVLPRQRGECLRGGDLHLHVDGGRAHVERAAEDVGEAEHVVDLIGVVGTAGRHDGVVADLRHFLGANFRIGIGHGEDDRLCRHRLDHLGRHGAFHREPEEHVGAFHRLGQGARLGFDRVRRLPLIHALAAAAIDHAFGVAQDHVGGRKPDRLEQLEAGDAGGARAVAHELG